MAADAPRVLVISNERIAARMAGPAIRALQLARQLHAREAIVTLAAPEQPYVDGLATTGFGTPSARVFRRLAEAHDVVVCQPQRVDVLRGLAASRARLIIDLYVPSFVERIAQLGAEHTVAEHTRAQLLERDRLEYAAAICLGDAFVCASERQRDHWLGALGQAGRLDLNLLDRDAAARSLIATIPFGVDDEQPVRSQPGLIRGMLVPEDAIVLVWTGGVWNWFDPVTVVEALARARQACPSLHLVVMGYRHPEAHQVEQEASRRMRERAHDLGLLESGALVLCDEWVPYHERARFLLDADAAVSAHHQGLETRLSYRTRILDHLWAGLPTITTRGGDLVDEVAARGAAITVEDGDIDGWVAAMVRIAEDAALREHMATAALTLGHEQRWSQIVEPLVNMVAEQAAGIERPPRRGLGVLERMRYAWLLVRVRVATKGLGSLYAALRAARGQSEERSAAR